MSAEQVQDINTEKCTDYTFLAPGKEQVKAIFPNAIFVPFRLLYSVNFGTKTVLYSSFRKLGFIVKVVGACPFLGKNPLSETYSCQAVNIPHMCLEVGEE